MKPTTRIRQAALVLCGLASTMGVRAALAAPACEIKLFGTDAIDTYKDEKGQPVKDITISKACKDYKVTLTHNGVMANTVMGHNFIVTPQATFDKAVATILSKYGKPEIPADKKYTPPLDPTGTIVGDTKLPIPIVATSGRLVQGKATGTKDSVTITMEKKNVSEGEPYTFFCAFPGHFSLMKGTLVWEKAVVSAKKTP